MQLIDNTREHRKWLIDAEGRRIGATQAAVVTHTRPGEGLEHDPYAVANLTLSLKISEALLKAYPGHPWYVGADSRQGIAFICIPTLMGRDLRNRYVIHLTRLEQDCARAVRMGGEILERFSIARKGYDGASYQDAINKQPPWLRQTGRAIMPT
jgi:hypothetical protein